MAGDKYLMDTNSLVTLADRTIRKEIIPHFATLSKNKELLTIKLVFDELKSKFPQVYGVFKKFRGAMIVPHRTDNEIRKVNDYIFRNHKNLYARYGAHNPPDPWLIAVAKVKGYIVVSDESRKKQKRRKIPFVCDDLGVTCINSREFLTRSGLNAP